MARLTIERPHEEDGTPRRRRSLALRLDGAAWLRVDAEVLAELGLSDGDEVDDERRAEVEARLARVQARLFVVRSLAAKAQSVAEIERKLAAREIPAEIARDAIERAAGYGYLNDAELAGQLARGLRSRGYGRWRAAQALRGRGLPPPEAEAALDEAYGDADDVALARAALARRPLTPDESGKRRAVAYLARRGFPARTAWQAVRAELSERGLT